MKNISLIDFADLHNEKLSDFHYNDWQTRPQLGRLDDRKRISLPTNLWLPTTSDVLQR